MNAIEVNWTPNQDDTASNPNQGPLPLSQKLRDQLTELDQIISSSDNPTATLEKVAQANQMSPKDLYQMLLRNRNDMQQHTTKSSTAAHSVPKLLLQRFFAGLVMLGSTAMKHPRQTTLLLLLLMIGVYTVWTAPKTGVILSTHSHWFSSGPTTLFHPPTSYLATLLRQGQDPRDRVPTLSPTQKSNLVQSSEDLSIHPSSGKTSHTEEGIFVPKLNRHQKKTWQSIVVARKVIPYHTLLPMMKGDEKDEKLDTTAEFEEDTILREDAVSLTFLSAQTILMQRRFSEWCQSFEKNIRFFSLPHHAKGNFEKRLEQALLVVPSMGDWNRFGLQLLQKVYEEQTEDSYCTVYQTIKGKGHFDGNIIVQIQKKGNGTDPNNHLDSIDEDSLLLCSVTILVPKNGKRLRETIMKTITSSLVDSIVSSTIIEARKELMRQLQSKNYRGRANARAVERRHLQYENMKKMENMAEDRRRRWQGMNPDAGRYRPSGIRMQSPNNC